MGKPTDLLRKGAELARQHKWHEGVDVYLQATEKAPTDSHCWLGLGVCLFRVGNLGMARVALDRSERMGHPKAGRALAWLEDAERLQGAKAGYAGAPDAGPDGRSAVEAGPPRPEVVPEEERIDLGRSIRVMLVEKVEADCEATKTAIEGTIKNTEVFPVLFTVSCSDTLSRSVQYDVAVLDWDAEPSAATGLTQILKIKRPEILIVCLTEKWNPQTYVDILEAGGDVHLVKAQYFRSVLPLIIAQQLRRDESVARQSLTDGASAPAEEAVDTRPPVDEASHEIVARIVEAAGDVLFTTDTRGNITWSSPAAAATGYAGQQLQGMAIAALFAPDSGQDVRDLVQQALDGTRACKRELPMARAAGERRWAELTLIQFKDDQEQTSGLEGLLRDVTDRKMTKEIRAILSGD